MSKRSEIVLSGCRPVKPRPSWGTRIAAPTEDEEHDMAEREDGNRRIQGHSSQADRSVSADWRRGYDETARHGPPLDASVARGDYNPGSDTLAPAGVRGFGEADTAERWGRGNYEGGAGGASADDATGIAGMEGDYAPIYNMPRSPESEGGWGRVGGWNSSGTEAQRPRGPKGYKRSDDRIREDLCEHLMDIGSIDLSDVAVHVHDGCVTLEGTVPERSMKHAIEDIAATTLGVADVENKLRVPRPRSEEGATARA
jgi:hypothetical protein